MTKFRVTYDIVTPESAEDGDFAEIGFVLPGSWHVSVADTADVEMDLRSALDLIGCVEDSGSWFTETDDGRVNYQTGAVERRSLHPPRNITASSYDRLKRLLNA